MNDKTQLEQIAEIFEQVGSEIMRHQKDGLSYYEAAEKTLDICQPKWIDVNDRLPDKSGYYLVVTTGFYKSDRAHIEKYSINENLHWYGLRDVTHWMPLPEPPEKSE